MHTTTLRKVGGSIMLAVPPGILKQLNLGAGGTVVVSLDGHRLIVESIARPHYRLADLLAEWEASPESAAEDREWLDSPPIGREVI